MTRFLHANRYALRSKTLWLAGIDVQLREQRLQEVSIGQPPAN
jgi:hypothetical protein